MKMPSEFVDRLNGLGGTQTQYQTDRYLYLIAELLIAIYTIQVHGPTPLGADPAITPDNADQERDAGLLKPGR